MYIYVFLVVINLTWFKPINKDYYYYKNKHIYVFD